MTKAQREYIAEAQRVVDMLKGRGEDSSTWEAEVAIREQVIASTSGGHSGTVK